MWIFYKYVIIKKNKCHKLWKNLVYCIDYSFDLIKEAIDLHRHLHQTYECNKQSHVYIASSLRKQSNKKETRTRSLSLSYISFNALWQSLFLTIAHFHYLTLFFARFCFLAWQTHWQPSRWMQFHWWINNLFFSPTPNQLLYNSCVYR